MEVGTFRPSLTKTSRLAAGEIGYLVTSFKDLRQVRVGDTLTFLSGVDKVQALPGYRPLAPLVYASLFPQERESFTSLREALNQLQFNDASLVFEPDSSPALGFGFRCGFLGLLHLEIVRERLEREFGLRIVIAVPSVKFRVALKNGTVITINRPADLPPSHQVLSLEEPEAKLEILTPPRYLGTVTELVRSREGILQETQTLDAGKALLIFRAPLKALIVDFHDQLKSRTEGLASESFWEVGYRPANLVKLEIAANGQIIEPFTVLVERKEAYAKAKNFLTRLKELIPRHLFVVVLQALVDNKVVAREELPALRKDVLAKLYGGDRTRKDKLLKKQKLGKKKMRAKGQVEIPPEAFEKLIRL